MSKEYEKWLETFCEIKEEKVHFLDGHIAKEAWNASKHYWLDKAVEVAMKEYEFLQGEDHGACKSVAEAIKTLKNKE